MKIHYLDDTTEILGNWLPTSEWVCIYDGGRLDFGWIGFKVRRGQVTKVDFFLKEPEENTWDVLFEIGQV